MTENVESVADRACSTAETRSGRGCFAGATSSSFACPVASLIAEGPSPRSGSRRVVTPASGAKYHSA
jgi:hypothetical protein